MILIVQSLWNESITEKLVQGAKSELDEKGFKHQVLQVPGALEIPLLIKWAWAKAQRDQSPFDGAIACGTVVKGETHHFEVVATESSRALMDLSVQLRLPIGFAVLAVYNIDQAIERSSGKHGNRGQEAATAVVDMLKLKERETY